MSFFFFFNDTATTEIYTLSLHDALPISRRARTADPAADARACSSRRIADTAQIHRQRSAGAPADRSEEHTSELQSPCNLVCRLLLEKKKKKQCILRLGHTRSCRVAPSPC